MADEVTKGFEVVTGLAQNTAATWGTGNAALLGAGTGCELVSEGLTADVTLIKNEAVSGFATQLPGATGAEMHNGDLTFKAYYQNGGVDVAAACLFGSVDAPVQQGGTAAYLHVHRLAQDHQGKYLTGVFDEETSVREYPYIKIVGGEFTIEQNNVGQWVFNTVPFGLNINRGTADDDYFVTAVDVANGALTLAQTTLPTAVREANLTVTVADANASVTEAVCTILAVHPRGHLMTLVYRLTTDGLTKTFPDRIASLVSATVSDVAGTVGSGVDQIKLGFTPGINNAATVGNISLPTQRDFVNFEQVRLFVNDQSAGAISQLTGSADEVFFTSLRIRIDPRMVPDDVSSRFGYRPDEPVKDAHIGVEVGFNISRKLTENVPLILDMLRKTKKKIVIQMIGPMAASPYPYRWTWYFNNVQFTAATSNVGGAQRVPLDVTGDAQRSLAVPTGFPTGYSDACYLETVTKRSTPLLA